MNSRVASAPKRSTAAEASTTLPRDFDIALPPMLTLPWLKSRRNGSEKESIPMSWKALVKNRA